MLLYPKQIQSATGAAFLCESKTPINHLIIDSRKISKGDMFVAIEGDNTDGHNFIEQAINNGASAILVERPIEENYIQLAKEFNSSVLLVDNTIVSLKNIAAYWRKCLKSKVIGITGSSGKTSTKNLIYKVLSSEYKVSATKGNYNNELGVPISLTNSNIDDNYDVIEMGMRGLGQITELSEFVKPDWGLITNVGNCHIELLGSQENIAKAKGELAEALPDNFGKMFLNVNDKYTDYIIKNTKLFDRNIEVVYFGGQNKIENYEGPQVWIEDIAYDEQGCPSFSLHSYGFGNDQVATCRLKLRGEHSIINGSAAAAVGQAANISLYDCVKVLNDCLPETGRQEILECPRGYTIVNDSYNANPDSMKASLVSFSKMFTEGKHIAILGDMAELGKYSKACHEKIGALINELNIDKLICVGDEAKNIAKVSSLEDVVLCKDNKDALIEAEKIIMPDDIILVKASNCMHLDYIVEGLKR